MCRVNVMAEKNKDSMNLTTIEYFKAANHVCNKFIKEDGMDESYLIDIGKYGTGSV